MPKIKRLPAVLFSSLLAMVLVAFAFSAFSPLTFQTIEGETYHFEAENIDRIVEVEGEEGFYIEESSGKIFIANESLEYFKQKAALKWANPFKEVAEADGQLHFGNAPVLQREGDQCDPKVDGYNVFHVQGFIYIDPTTFIVIDDNRSFGECPCDDPAVKRGKKANCPHVHHRTKKKIIDRARSCGLGDWFPVRRCR
ncbi:MAG: hypothetical protein KTR30_14440 [Saprospiraceae bacterium]|nr:hypothetical protein [Saprospiraceae bacterium]